jgi:hypothetical protein
MSVWEYAAIIVYRDRARLVKADINSEKFAWTASPDKPYFEGEILYGPCDVLQLISIAGKDGWETSGSIKSDKGYWKIMRRDISDRQ